MLRLEDFWECSMTILRRELNNERIDSNFVRSHPDAIVHAFFPDISNAEIIVMLEGDECDENEEDY